LVDATESRAEYAADSLANGINTADPFSNIATSSTTKSTSTNKIANSFSNEIEHPVVHSGTDPCH
jgi:hypothetical protein